MEVLERMTDEFIEGELIYYARQLPTSLKKVWIVPISDAHYGNPLFSKKHFIRTIDYILKYPDVYTLLNGDLCEAATKISRGDVYTQKLTPQEQRDWIIGILTPIKHKILGMVTGNHESRIYNETGIDISLDIARALGVPYRSSGMLLKISFGNYNKHTKGKPFVFWGYFTHGYGGARTKAAKAIKAERLATFVDADFYCMSHDHTSNASPSTYLKADPRTRLDDRTGFRIGKVSAHRKVEVKTNAYLKWGNYSEQGGFPPTDLFTPIIKLLSLGDDLIGHKQAVRVEV